MSDIWSQHQFDIYRQSQYHGILPKVTTDPVQLAEQAREKLGPHAFNYVAGGAGERATIEANRLAFRQWKMIPRVMRPVEHRDTSVTLFGKKYPSPLIAAPMGSQGLFHPDKEQGTAKACADLNIPFCLSTLSSTSIEDAAAANGSGPRWFQLYSRDKDLSISLLNRAERAGFEVLLVTIDTWALAWRPMDLDSGYYPFLRGVGNDVGFTDPAYRKIFKKMTGKTIEEDVVGASHSWLEEASLKNPHSWDEIHFLRKHWKGPIVLKGVQHVEDAVRAAELGVDGIVVSNHGGRQVDGAIASLDVLPEIASAVGDKVTVLFDSGTRTGMDVLKALCLGAKGVLIGRPVLYGLAIDGKDGVSAVLKNIATDLWLSMGLSGIGSVAECSRQALRKVSYSENLKAML